ncbi:MAG: CARDB domain-containing protein [Candidatus Bathyarchaeota archaeon]|nr:CARDB domain-containing protein [Candidatus Bathyarchaeota archaeon]
MKLNLVKLLALLTLSALFISTNVFSPSYAASPRIYLEPSNHYYTTDTAYVGMKFNVTVWCTDVPNLGGAQIYVEYNDTIVNATRWFVPDTDPSFFMPLPYAALPTPPNTGYIHLGPKRGSIKVSVSKGGLPPNPPWGHAGKICVVEFNITAVPATPGKYTSLLKIDTEDTFLLDPTANEVPGVIKQNGYYEIRKPGPQYSLTITSSSGGTTNPAPGIYIHEGGTIVSVTAIPAINYALDHWELDSVNVGSANPIDVTMDANHNLHAVFVFSPPVGARIFVDPPEIIEPHAIPCQTNFYVNISVDDIADMKTCEFNLTYNTNVISIIGLNFLSVGGKYPSINLNVNDLAGFIWVKLTYATAITITEPTPLVMLTFHVDNLGVSPLDLTDTQIKDSGGNDIPHDTYDGLFIAVIRDVAVKNIVLSRTWAYPGWPVNITVTVKNEGNVSETFDLYTFYDSIVIGTQTVNNLAPNEERDVVFTWDTTGVGEGNYTIKAEAQQVPYEMDTADNVLVDGKVWIMTHVHDVAVVDIALSDSWAFPGWVVEINVTAANLGDFTETFDVKAYYNTTLIGTVHVENLPPGDNYFALFTLNTTGLLPCHTQIISGEATLVPYEFNETNNILVDGGLKIRYTGDVNGDGVVDLKDYLIVAAAFGSYPGHPRWNPVADINRDNMVDLKDVFIVAKNYGQGCPP